MVLKHGAKLLNMFVTGSGGVTMQETQSSPQMHRKDKVVLDAACKLLGMDECPEEVQEFLPAEGIFTTGKMVLVGIGLLLVIGWLHKKRMAAIYDEQPLGGGTHL